jgi:hypothetical protein
MHAGLKPETGDVANVAVYADESDSAHVALAGLGWFPQEDEAPAE